MKPSFTGGSWRGYRRPILAWISFALGCGVEMKAQLGVDTGFDPPAFAREMKIGEPALLSRRGWVRIRELAIPGQSSAAQVELHRRALGEIRNYGLRICVLLMASGPWAGGMRGIPGSRLPLDLREAYSRMARINASYRDLVDVWEIDNEPDIGFLPENPEAYAAYLKACYLSVHRASGGGAGDLGLESRLIMAPLALPPGPYLERLVANDLLGSTDGFNYHFYGYDADFTGVYRQFEAAISDVSVTGSGNDKQLPVFLTECGYGMLGLDSSDTVAGRVGQWRWFKSVAEQIFLLRPAAPMMFLLRPYAERNLTEFGLEAVSVKKLAYTPPDFGEHQASRWMEGIGKRTGQGIASPALAYLKDAGLTHAYFPRPWIVHATAPSSVVIDFVSGKQMEALKSFQGYALSGETKETRLGDGELRIYNFSGTATSGELRFEDALAASSIGHGNLRLKLEPQEMRVIPVSLTVPCRPWAAHIWTVIFAPDTVTGRASTFSTLLYPAWRAAPLKTVVDFRFSSAQNAKTRLTLMAQPRAEEEPALEQDGRWLVTKGLHVEDWLNRWEFEIRDLPKTSLRPAKAELPLPDGFSIPANSLLRLDQRCESTGPVLTRYAGFSEANGGIMQIQFRTAQGNLYEVWPRRQVVASWQTYEESADNFTMSFFGRANLPWKFRDDQPVALVFTFWPRSLPTSVSIKAAALVRPE